MLTKTFSHTKTYTTLLTAWSLFAFSSVPVQGASHSDAPLIKQDPQANITDVYAFVGTRYNDPNQKVLNVVTQVRPLSEPGDGPHYERFADDALYSIHLTNPTTGETVLRYNFEFSAVSPQNSPGLKNPNTLLSYGVGTEVGPILNVGGARQNYTQTYEVQKQDNTAKKKKPIIIGSNLLTPPANVGLRTTPDYNDPTTGKAVSGATTFDALDSYTQQTIYDLPTGEAVFAGSREDGFYLDIAGLIDLLDPRILGDSLGQAGNGVDGFKGYNVLAYAMQIPVDALSSVPGFPTVGVYASVSRRATTVRKKNGETISRGAWRQVNRMGNPLYNEGFVALQDKDNYNRTSPTDDDMFKTYALNPELARLINFVVFGGSEVIQETGRSDLVSIFIPDVLRVNTATDPVPLAGQTNFNRLSVFGNDFTNGVPSGFPNGRRFGDDVVDIALTALAGQALPILGDNVNANDQVFHQVFPYSATPHAGTNTRHDP